MGMFDRDKQFGNRLDQEFDLKEKFIIWGAKLLEETVSTDFGDATPAVLEVSRIETPGDHYEVSTVASAIVEKVEGAEEGDFPAVVELRKVKSKKFKREALVLQFVKPYGEQA